MDIEKIKYAIQTSKVNISDHADEELENDAIEDDDLYYSTVQGEVIEDYTDDKPFPSCLIYGKDNKNRNIHRWINYKIRKPKR